MKKSRRIGAVVAMATATIGMTSASAAAPATADARGPEPVSMWLRPVRAHTDTWIDISWRTKQRVCDASVKYYSRDVDIDYRGNRRSATFSRGDSLTPWRGDYTTIRVDPDMDRGGLAKLRAVISYDSCGRKARTETRSFTLTLPVQRNNHPGDDDRGRPGRPGDDDNGWPDNDNRGRPGNDDNRGRPGNDDNRGRPGNDDNRGRPGNDDNRGRPGNDDNRGRPTPGASPTTTATPAATATATPAATATATPAATATATPTATATTTPPVAIPTTSSAPPPAHQGNPDQHGHRGNR